MYTMSQVLLIDFAWSLSNTAFNINQRWGFFCVCFWKRSQCYLRKIGWHLETISENAIFYLNANSLWYKTREIK